MFSLWAVVRYVIVKPVKHLRDVTNAVREGDVEQRAVIHTGDEFEELGAAFNRMLRQLLSQQSELRAKSTASWTSGSTSWPRPTCGCTR